MYEIIKTGGSKTEPANTVVKKTEDDGTELWIPLDINNSDYQKYLQFLEETK